MLHKSGIVQAALEFLDRLSLETRPARARMIMLHKVIYVLVDINASLYLE